MQPDQPIIQPANIPESPLGGEQNTQDKSAEVVSSPEVLTGSGPVDPQQITADEPVTLPVIPDEEPASEFVTSTAAPKEVDDTAVLTGDSQYFSAVKKLIKEDAEKPYEEEEDSEELQKGYLKERFGVDVAINDEEGK